MGQEKTRNKVRIVELKERVEEDGKLPHQLIAKEYLEGIYGLQRQDAVYRVTENTEGLIFEHLGNSGETLKTAPTHRWRYETLAQFMFPVHSGITRGGKDMMRNKCSKIEIYEKNKCLKNHTTTQPPQIRPIIPNRNIL